MTRLDDFLGPLFEGTKEVIVPKSKVTDLLDPGWKKSAINIPSPDMIDSYRKGPLHLHEFIDEYRVHLDRYDPEKHAVLHLIDDAPMLLMVWGTVSTLSMEAAEAARGGMEDKMHSLRGTYRARILVGVAIVLVGVVIFLFPLEGTAFLFLIALPSAVVFFGAAEIVGALFRKKEEKFVDAAVGAIVVVLGIMLFVLTKLEVLIVLLALSVWLLGSAYIYLRAYSKVREISKKDATPKLIIGIVSLAMGIGVVLVPAEVFVVLMFALGTIVMLIGIIMIASGFGLRNALKALEANRPKEAKQTVQPIGR